MASPLHDDRAQAMLWRWRTSDAERMIPFVDAAQALIRARVALIRGQQRHRSHQCRPRPAPQRPRPRYDRYNHLAEGWRLHRRARDPQGPHRLRGPPGRALPVAAWRAQIVRWLLREGRAEEAYDLAASHQLSEHSDVYADLEWLAGFLSLRFLDQPERALAHFQASEAAVEGPISVSRAAYWQGRAEDALGRPDDAAFSYARGARHQTAFYGLLAAERLGLPLDPRLTGGGRSATGAARPTWRSHAPGHAPAARRRRAVGCPALRPPDRPHGDRAVVGQLANLLEEMHEPYIGVLVGKAAAERGVVVPAAYFPLHPMAQRDWPVGADLALSIARRESEFNAGVSSPVGAQGLMQVMPATAREVAGWLGLPYSQARLTDWEYNAALGTRYLQMLEEMFGNSPVLIAAGYNAGPGRPRQWMAARGDIRETDVDVIDWIEMIPFAETRTYVIARLRIDSDLPRPPHGADRPRPFHRHPARRAPAYPPRRAPLPHGRGGPRPGRAPVHLLRPAGDRCPGRGPGGGRDGRRGPDRRPPPPRGPPRPELTSAGPLDGCSTRALRGARACQACGMRSSVTVVPP
jgi:soluble lytic murein transglycosylase